MRWLSRGLCNMAVALCGLLSLTAAAAPASHTVRGSQAYEAKLPAELPTASDMCALIPCADVFPGATGFSERKGQPPYVEAYGGADGKELLGYVMLSTDITDTPAYSGKPVVTLIGMDTTGKYVGVKVLKHSEPILLLGIPESALLKFNDQYLGRSVKDNIEVGQSRPEDGVIGVDAIAGATVTVVAQNQVIMTSGSAVARQVGIIEPVVRKPVNYVEPKSDAPLPNWEALVRQGAVQRLTVQPEQVGLQKTGSPFIDLWFGSLNSPIVGPAILGQNTWQHLMNDLKEGENAIFIIRTGGNESFKGSGFVRGGIYDRVQIFQDGDTFTFRDLDAKNLYGLGVKDAPRFSESAIFIIRSKAFSAAYPWKLSFLANKLDRETGQKTFLAFDREYWLPDAYLVGGRPEVVRPDPAWLKIWKARPTQITVFALLLVALGVVYALREKLTRRSTHKNTWPVNAFKYSFWVIFITWVGFGLLAQPSVTQILTWFHSILFKWEWTLFLSDPFIFLFWVFIAITVIVFGRGLFCGWACPFGSLQELLHVIGEKIGLKKYQFLLPVKWHDRLKWVKYAVFFVLLAVSLFSMVEAEKLAEVEPFKTTFLVGITNRSWPYGAFVLLILALAVFMERPYCKYICPLGAALAMPSTFRWFGLKRKPDCNTCKACAKACGSLAINANGQIDHRECMHCLDCMILYTDQTSCPPLAKERKLRSRNGDPLTPIGKDGYFIPIIPETPTPAQLPVTGVDPRLPTAPVFPAFAQQRGVRRFVGELIDHLWPFSRASWQASHMLVAAGAALAITATFLWILAAQDSVTPLAMIGTWFGWSVLEVFVRLSGKRYVKDGPWWGSVYRRANIMDMLSYVSFKNLLIGAALFWALAPNDLLAAPVQAVVHTVRPGETIQAAIDRAAAGDTIRIERGLYRENLRIEKTLTLQGVHRPTISGGQKGDTIRVTAPDVVLDGLNVRDSGDSLRAQNAGIYIQPGAHRAIVRNSTLSYNLFGLWIEKAHDVQVLNNVITGKRDYDSARRGNGVQLYNTKGARIIENHISFVRDALYVDVSHHAVFQRNLLHHSRYGTHYMNSYYNLWEDNDTWSNRGGLALMEVRDQVIRNNRAWNNADHGIMLRTLQDATVDNNWVMGNGRGLFIYDTEYTKLRGNIVADNRTGVHMSGSINNELDGNDFIENHLQVKYAGTRDQPWGGPRGNFWSNYRGWDRDDDGRGDIPYEANDMVDRLSWRYPTVRMLLASPAIQALRMVGQQFPILRVPSIVEKQPRMLPQSADWATWRKRLKEAPNDVR